MFIISDPYARCICVHYYPHIAVIQEEVVNLRKKVERAKKIEMANNADEVLQEELREYKVFIFCCSYSLFLVKIVTVKTEM
jgi:hypothetical protein